MKIFHIYVENLFIQEGIKAILINKYPDLLLRIISSFDEFNVETTEQGSILITDNPSIVYNHQPKLKSLVIKKQIKLVMIANSTQVEGLKENDLSLIDALIYTNCSLNDLHEALNFIQAGMQYRCKRLDSVMQRNNYFESLLKTQQISGRENEIIKLVILGLTSNEIAEKLNISYYTVTTHRRNINKKLNIKSPQDLIRLAVEHP